MVKKTKKRYDDGGEIVVTGTRPSGSNIGALPVNYSLSPSYNMAMPDSTKPGFSTTPTGGGGSGSTNKGLSFGSIGTPAGKVYGLRGSSGPTSYGFGYNPKTGVVGGNATFTFKKGGAVKIKKMAKGGTASKRADGCAVKGKTRGKMV